jgi:hypothetical protein
VDPQRARFSTKTIVPQDIVPLGFEDKSMIYESRYWKEPLLRAASWLEKLRVRDETIDVSLARVEREVFIGFFAIRKLLDTFKVSSSTKKLTFNLSWSPCLAQIDYLNAHRIDQLFGLDNGKSVVDQKRLRTKISTLCS